MNKTPLWVKILVAVLLGGMYSVSIGKTEGVE